MEKRQWTSQQKLQIVLEGLSGKIDLANLCAKYQIAQTQYYRWRDQLLKHGYQAFEVRKPPKRNGAYSKGFRNSRRSSAI